MAEIGRRLVHASGAAAPASYLLGILSWEVLGWLLAVGLVVVLVLEAVRLRIGLDWWVYENLIREYEREKIAGYALYMIGMVVASAFPPAIGVPAMLMLTIADPVGGYLGSGNRKKGVGALATVFTICFLLAIPFVSTGVAILGALAATAADGYLVSVRGYIIDDNLTIPLVSAVTMWLGVTLI